MKSLSLLKRLIVGVCVPWLLAPSLIHAQTTQIANEYLMTLYAPLDAPQQIDGTLFIYNVLGGGWAKGPGSMPRSSLPRQTGSGSRPPEIPGWTYA